MFGLLLLIKIILRIFYLNNLKKYKIKYLKHIEGQKGLYEARITLGSNIWRVFCFFDQGQLVILLNGFQKKTQKTPKSEIDKAILLMQEYFNDKNK